MYFYFFATARKYLWTLGVRKPKEWVFLGQYDCLFFSEKQKTFQRFNVVSKLNGVFAKRKKQKPTEKFFLFHRKKKKKNV